MLWWRLMMFLKMSLPVKKIKNDDWSCNIDNIYFIFVFYQRNIWWDHDWEYDWNCLSTGMNNSKRIFASRWSTRYSNINTNSNARKKLLWSLVHFAWHLNLLSMNKSDSNSNINSNSNCNFLGSWTECSLCWIWICKN